MTVQFGHQRLAEAHHFAFAFAFRIKIAAAFTAAHRQGGEGIFKGLFKAEELQDRQVNRRVETHPALEWTNRRAELDTPGAVDLHLITVVNPHYAELDHALGFNQAFKQRHLTVARVLFQEWPEGGHHFTYGLSKFALMWVTLLNAVQKGFKRARLVHIDKFL